MSIGWPDSEAYLAWLGRTTTIVSALAPDEINKVNVHVMNGDIEVATFMINREKFDAAKNYKGSPHEIFKTSKLESNSNDPLISNSIFNPIIKFPEFSWSMSPALKHQIGRTRRILLRAIILVNRYIYKV